MAQSVLAATRPHCTGDGRQVETIRQPQGVSQKYVTDTLYVIAQVWWAASLLHRRSGGTIELGNLLWAVAGLLDNPSGLARLVNDILAILA